MQRPSLRLHFLGHNTADHEAAVRFVSKSAGLPRLDSKPDWTLFKLPPWTLEVFTQERVAAESSCRPWIEPGPRFAGAELHTRDFAAQLDFYTRVLGLEPDGLEPDGTQDGRAILHDPENGARLCLRDGGGASPVATLEEQPFFLGFEVDDIAQGAAWCEACGVEIRQAVTRKDWGGIDLHAVDADGGILQIVQYLHPTSDENPTSDKESS